MPLPGRQIRQPATLDLETEKERPSCRDRVLVIEPVFVPDGPAGTEILRSPAKARLISSRHQHADKGGGVRVPGYIACGIMANLEQPETAKVANMCRRSVELRLPIATAA